MTVTSVGELRGTAMTYIDDQNPDLRASDAERDAVVTELGQHFQDGRLDNSEFDQRISAAMTARTRRDLGVLLADLPGRQADSGPPSAISQAPVPDHGRPRLLAVLPLIVAAVIAASALSGWHHSWSFLLVIGIVAVRLRIVRERRQAGRPLRTGGKRRR
jgi:hypothetical protein